jgi:acetylornithine deacetylase/succinyl-diaminopimelate desuccinylase
MGKKKTMSVLDEVCRLIEIPSVTGEEGAIARYLEKRLAGTGCQTRIHEAAPGRFNVYAELPGAKSGASSASGTPNASGAPNASSAPDRPALLFHGHIDTVPPHGMENPFAPRIEAGQVFGRGSVDQKGGIAAVITAFESLISSNVALVRPVALVCVIDEESEHRGSMALRDMGIEADFGVVTEPTGLKLGIGCKGTAPILVHVQGRAAHGCRPWLGENAVMAGLEIAQSLMAMEMPRKTLEGIGEVVGSINLGKIEGGRAYNIVADTCDIWFDRRTIPGETQWTVLKEFKERIEACEASTRTKVEARIARPDWHWEPIQNRGLISACTAMADPNVSCIAQAHQSVLGDEPKTFFTDGYQEMDFLINDLGMNAVQYGPGDSSLCHTDHEHLDIAQLESCVKVYAAMTAALCGTL